MALINYEPIINTRINGIQSPSSIYFNQPKCYPQGKYLYLGKKFEGRAKLTTNGAKLVRSYLNMAKPVLSKETNLLTANEMGFLEESFPDSEPWQAQLDIYLKAYESLQREFKDFAAQKYGIHSSSFETYRLYTFEVCRDYCLMPEAMDEMVEAVNNAVSSLFGPRSIIKEWTKDSAREGQQIEWVLSKGTGSGRYEKTLFKVYRKTSTNLRLEFRFCSPKIGIIPATDFELIKESLTALVDKATRYLNIIDDAITAKTMSVSEFLIIKELEKIVKRPMAKDCYRYFVSELAKSGSFDIYQAPVDYRGTLTYMLRKAMATEGPFVEKQSRIGNRGPIKKNFYVIAPRLREQGC